MFELIRLGNTNKDRLNNTRFFEIKDVPKNINPPQRPVVEEFLRKFDNQK